MAGKNEQQNKGFTQHHFFYSKKGVAGFTLIELLVTIAIIGILSAVVLTSMSGARNQANDGRRVSDIKNIQLALEIYYDVNSQYPATGTLYVDPKPLRDFLKISKDPTSGNNYFYWSDGQNYHLGALLQEYNKLIKEDDDDTNGFGGYTTDCASAAPATADDERCYDVTP